MRELVSTGGPNEMSRLLFKDSAPSGSDISISNETRLLMEVSLAIETFRWEHFLTIPEPVRSNYSKVHSF